MCGRYVLKTDGEELQARFGFRSQSDEPYVSYNIAPGRLIPSIFNKIGGERALGAVRWGLEMGQGNRPLINARAETVETKQSFSQAFRHSRCIVPADAFYEWSRHAGQALPHLIEVDDGKTFGMAALMVATGRGDQTTDLRVVIITTESSPALRAIHHRMPAVLAPNTYDMWLGTPPARCSELRRILAPLPDGLLSHRRVSTRVNNAGNDSPELMEEIGAGAKSG